MKNVVLERRAQVAVVGGGLAGAVVALRLARLGVAVVALEPAATRADFSRSTPVATLPVLEQLELAPEDLSSLLAPISEASVYWAGTAVASPHPSVLVNLAGLVSALRAAARAAGVQQLSAPVTPALVREPSGRWSATAGEARVEADVLIVSGAVQLPAEPRLYGAPTAAWVASWPGPPEAPARVLVEASGSGWAWFVSAPAGRRYLSVAREPTPDEGTAVTWQRLRTELGHGRMPLPSHVPELARLDASSYRFAPAIGEGLLRVGSACFTVDPLSSQGMVTSITNALQAVAVANTLLRHPQDAAYATSFYAQRVEEACARSARHAAAFYAEGAARFHTTFWQRRSISPPEQWLARRSGPVPNGTLQMGGGAQLVLEPVLNGDRIAPQVVLRSPALDRPVAYLGGVPVVQALHQALCGNAARPLLEWLWGHRVLEQGHATGRQVDLAPGESSGLLPTPVSNGAFAHGYGRIESQ